MFAAEFKHQATIKRDQPEHGMCPLQTADVFPKNGNYRRTGRVYQD
jgi:hypothetical protein